MMNQPLEQPCDSQRIDDYLNERLSSSEQSEFESHLSRCESCQQQIQSRAAEPDLWKNAAVLLGQSAAVATDAALEHEAGPDRAAASESDADRSNQESSEESGGSFRSRQVQSVLESLSPTENPEMLGRIDDYEIIGVVGVGGMGAVLKGFDESLRRVVAIKIMSPHLAGSGSARTRFQREARAAAAITHDNVIDIYGVSESNGLPYLVMPFARGPSLQKRIDEGGPLSVTEVLRIGRQIAAGLTAAHEQGLVHRDIKPANILLNDGIERLLITDFGVARAMDDASMTRTGVIAGTPQYMSPEQARGETVDYRSDLFSLGSVLYTACTGRPPFRSETAYGILRRITDDDPRPVREINSDIPEWLCRIINRLMSKHPADRFQNAAEVSELLENCLAHLQQPTHVPLPQSIASPPSNGAKVIGGSEFLASQRERSGVGNEGRTAGGWWAVLLSRRALLVTVTLLLMASFGLVVLNRLGETNSLNGDPSEIVASAKPLGRAQAIQAPIEGRIVRWGEGIVENARVRKGQLIAEIQETDAGSLARREDQIANAKSFVEAKKSEFGVMEQNLEATKSRVAASQAQTQAYEQVYDNLTLSNDKRVASAKKRREADLQRLKSLEALFNLETEALERTKASVEAGQDNSVEKLIEAQRRLIEAEAKLSEAKASIESAENDVAEKQNEGDAHRLKAQADLDQARALLIKAGAEASMADGEVANGQYELARAQQELRDLETSLARQEQQQIIAPFDGVVTQLTGPEQLVKEGDPICTLTPF
jgi:serine/threonine protein kinase/multidrug resistance efflux pump